MLFPFSFLRLTACLVLICFSTAVSAEGVNAVCDELLTLRARLLRGQPVQDTEEPDATRDAEVQEVIESIRAVPVFDSILDSELLTPFGRLRWKYIVRHPEESVDRIRETQAVIAELADNHELRGKIRELLAHVHMDVEDDVILEALSPQPEAKRRDLIARWWFGLSSGTTASGIGLSFVGLPFVGMVLGFILGLIKRFNEKYNNVTRVELAMFEPFVRISGELATLLKGSPLAPLHALGEVFGQEPLVDLQQKYAATAPQQFQKAFGRLGMSAAMTHTTANGFASVLDGIGVTALTLPKLRHAVEESKEVLALTMSALAQLDVYVAIAEFMNRKKTVGGREISYRNIYFQQKIREGDEAYLSIEDGYHPHLLEGMNGSLDWPEPYTLELSKDHPVILLVGSGRRGGRTFIRNAGLHAYAARIGFPSPGHVETSVMQQFLVKFHFDGIGEQTIQQQGDRIIELVRKASSGKPSILIIDQLVEGTGNPRGLEASTTLLKYILDNLNNCVAVVGTHYAELAAQKHDRLRVLVMEKDENKFSVSATADPDFDMGAYIRRSLPAAYADFYDKLSERQSPIAATRKWFATIWQSWAR